MSFLLKDKTSTPVPTPNNFFRESKEIKLKNKINKHKTSSLSMCDVFVVIIFTVLAIYCNGWLVGYGCWVISFIPSLVDSMADSRHNCQHTAIRHLLKNIVSLHKQVTQS